MGYRLLALDLDGTALGADPDQFAPGVIDVLEAVSARGIQVVIATGRALSSLPSGLWAQPHDWLRYGVLFDGGELWDFQKETSLRRAAIHGAGLSAVEAIAREFGLIPEYVDSGSRYYIRGEDWDTHLQRGMTPFHRRILARMGTRFSGASRCLEENDILKINLFYIPPSLWGKVTARLDEAGLNAMESAPGCLEITSQDAGKDQAVRFLAEKMGYAMEEVMAIGDSGNDVSLLKSAGLGIAMGNAPDFVKAAANGVTEKNTSSGAAAAIRKYLL